MCIYRLLSCGTPGLSVVAIRNVNLLALAAAGLQTAGTIWLLMERPDPNKPNDLVALASGGWLAGCRWLRH